MIIIIIYCDAVSGFYNSDVFTTILGKMKIKRSFGVVCYCRFGCVVELQSDTNVIKKKGTKKEKKERKKRKLSDYYIEIGRLIGDAETES